MSMASLLDSVRMERRAFIVAMTGGLLTVPLAAEAQPACKVYRIGLLDYSVPDSPPRVCGGRRLGQLWR